MTTFHITKYALSSGAIKTIEAEAEYPEYVPEGWVKDPGSTGWNHYRLGKEAFDNLPDAIADAEARRTKKIASLRKQIAKLEKMEFSA